MSTNTELSEIKGRREKYWKFKMNKQKKANRRIEDGGWRMEKWTAFSLLYKEALRLLIKL
jgi:hypothetical protein